MRRMHLWLSLFLSQLVVCVVAIAVWGFPSRSDFYASAMESDPDQDSRRRAAKALVDRTRQILRDSRVGERFDEQFTQSQVNCWLAEELPQRFGSLMPESVRDPRVHFEPHVIHLGFRYERPNWQGIVHLQITPQVRNGNQLALRIESVHAGLVPIPLEKVVERLSSTLTTDTWFAEWEQREDGPVLLITFRESGDAPILESVRIAEGAIRIKGRRRSDNEAPRSPRLAQSSRSLPTFPVRKHILPKP